MEAGIRRLEVYFSDITTKNKNRRIICGFTLYGTETISC